MGVRSSKFQGSPNRSPAFEKKWLYPPTPPGSLLKRGKYNGGLLPSRSSSASHSPVTDPPCDPSASAPVFLPPTHPRRLCLNARGCTARPSGAAAGQGAAEAPCLKAEGQFMWCISRTRYSLAEPGTPSGLGRFDRPALRMTQSPVTPPSTLQLAALSSSRHCAS